MSLEALLEANTKAVERHNELLEQVLSKAGASTTSTSKPATKAKDADADEKPAPRTRRTAKPKVDVKMVKEIATIFVDVEDDDEYEARASIVRKVCKSFDVEKVTEVAKEDAEEFHAALTKAIEDYENEGAPSDEEEKPARRRREV